MNKASAPPLPAGSLYMEEVHVKLGEELWFTVGCPNGIHQKQVDQMVIHSASDPRPKTTLFGDYFYNYFACGFDVYLTIRLIRSKNLFYIQIIPGMLASILA
ncbi:hypothetical protein L1987_05748 [Smallanthus sonchifolius]|uniref:Uncharacterized protein n=1 Tax=Smallanthus sonchifolius TaxID=185202 RepID=A0ACB9JW81_9ASTR|nr:hypothetical protein L1987_05748 [Smallanthus sonchifolius]